MRGSTMKADYWRQVERENYSPTDEPLVVESRMWETDPSRRLIAGIEGRWYSCRNLVEARELAAKYGYPGIRVVFQCQKREERFWEQLGRAVHRMAQNGGV